MLKGRTVNLLIPPSMEKNNFVDERFLPKVIDMRNVRLSDRGNAYKRGGLSESNLTTNPKNASILGFIPENTGYFIHSTGDIYSCPENILKDTAEKINDAPLGTGNFTYIKFKDRIYVFNGVAPYKITGKTITKLYDVKHAKFASLIHGYAILSGYNDYEFSWQAPNNPENSDIAYGAGFATLPEKILNQIEFQDRLFFFHNKKIDVWTPTGVGDSPFRQQPGLSIPTGLAAERSVIKTENALFWFGDNFNFYMYSGGNAVNISESYNRELAKMGSPSTLIGMHIRKEGLVMWVNSIDGKTFIYDYKRGIWLEDNARSPDGWQAMPFSCYMELYGNRQFFGSSKLDGKIYEYSLDFLDDNGVPIRAIRHFKVMLSKRHNTIRVNLLRFRRKAGGGGNFTIEWRWDGSGDWSTQNISLGETGDYDPNIDVRDIGSGRELEIMLSEEDNCEFLLTDMICVYEELLI